LFKRLTQKKIYNTQAVSEKDTRPSAYLFVVHVWCFHRLNSSVSFLLLPEQRAVIASEQRRRTALEVQENVSEELQISPKEKIILFGGTPGRYPSRLPWTYGRVNLK